MRVLITGHHLEITDSLRNFTEQKFEKLARHFDQVTDVNVILSVEKLMQKAEASVHVLGVTLFAEDHQEDMYVAIDHVVDKLDRQIGKQRDKVNNHR